MTLVDVRTVWSMLYGGSAGLPVKKGGHASRGGVLEGWRGGGLTVRVMHMEGQHLQGPELEYLLKYCTHISHLPQPRPSPGREQQGSGEPWVI